MKTIHLISHTHWDREWYRTFQQFRLQLVHLVDGLLDILATDRDYKHFMLDGQTIALDDYLLMRPEAESTLTKHIRTGRVLIGPWHILPDMFLVSPEAHIRNLLAGDRVGRRFGPKMMIGYMPDSFGHIGQMPQILQGFGIDNACLWRGLDDQPAEFWWQSPDGTRVLMLYLRDSYGNGAGLNVSDANQFTTQIRDASESLAAHSAAEDYLVMLGTDHMEPSPDTSKAIKVANQQLKDYHVIHSTIPAYRAAIQAKIVNRKSEIPTVVGELRSSKRSHLLPGVLSTRMWIKQRNHACENLLEKWTEPFSTFASWTTDAGPQSALRRPSSIVHQAWLLLLQNHPHDSICGCSIDQVHDEMRPRFDQVEQIGEEITKQSLEAMAGAVNTSDQLSVISCQSAIVVFNPLSVVRTDPVSAELSLSSGISNFEIVDEDGRIIPHQSTSGKTSDLINVRAKREELGGLLGMIHEGRAGNLAIQDMKFSRDGASLRVEAVFAENTDPKIDVWNNAVKAFDEYLADPRLETFHIHAHSPDSANLTFAAPDVPALGWKTFYVRGKESAPAEIHITPLMRLLAPLAKLPVAQKLLAKLVQPKAKPPYIIENELFAVKLNINDRTLSVTDKTTGKVHHGLNRFVDSGDCGDEYNFSPPPADLRADTATLHGVTFTRGPVQQTMTVSLALKVPAALSADRKSRSTEMVEIPITTTVMLTNGVPRVDIHTQVDNRARDHRLRVHFPAPFTVNSADYDGHFEIVKRPIGVPPFDATWAEEPRPETHQSAFTSVSNGTTAFTIANRGLPEVEVLRSLQTSHSEIAITLLRCVGWLSRDDFSTRKSHAGPFLETPSAQMIGEWEFDYSIIVGSIANWSHQQAWNFESPLRAASTGIHAGTLSASGSFVSVDHSSFVVSAVKESEDGRGWSVRGYNIGDDEISVTLTPWRKFKKAERVNMADEKIAGLKIDSSGGVAVKTRGHEVVTVMFRK
jgi:mannosylglycerate hydrolase